MRRASELSDGRGNAIPREGRARARAELDHEKAEEPTKKAAVNSSRNGRGAATAEQTECRDDEARTMNRRRSKPASAQPRPRQET